MQKKRLRLLAALLAAVLTLGTLAGSFDAQAKSDLVYLFINDTLIKSMTSSNMPLRINNSMYISYRYLIRIRPIKYFYDEDIRILRVYNSRRTLIFDVGNSITYDQDGKIYSYLAEVRNGVLYVPIEFICRTFGAVYTQFDSEYGPVLRINSNLSQYSNSELLELNSEAMKMLYDEYYGIEEPAPDDSTVTQPDPPEPVRPRDIYPMICGPLNEYTPSLLNAIDSYGSTATFFLTGEGLSEQGDLLRRIVCSGYALGLYVSAEDPVGQAESINDLLSSMVFRRSRVVCIREGSKALSEEQRTALTQAGYRIWDGIIDPGSSTRNGYSVGINGQNLLKNAASTSSLVLYSTEGARDGIYTLLRYMQQNSFTALPISDWTTPVNAAKY